MSQAQVPLLTKSAIHLAHLCALETWQGYSYSKGTLFNNLLVEHSPGSSYKSTNLLPLSDEYLMSRFATHLLSIIYPKEFKNTTPISISLINLGMLQELKQLDVEVQNLIIPAVLIILKNKYQMTIGCASMLP